MIDVELTQGVVRGSRTHGVESFLGIPYAAPPFGANRFRHPVPPEPWGGVRVATSFGPAAPKPHQPPVFEALLPDASEWGEDCLTLNVWKPTDPPPQPMPVMVWIHGGGYLTGSNAVPMYNGSSFARKHVVAVAINYRLGVEGFSRLEGATPNRGLLDMIAALRWIQNNIDAFGGDSARVTIAGQSAGAMAVLTLLSMPSAQGLFHRAAAFSGSAQMAIPSDLATYVTQELAQLLGVEPTAQGFAGVEITALLDALEPLQLRVTSGSTKRSQQLRRLFLALCPEIDGSVLPHLPIEGIAAGAGGSVDLLIGTTSNEFTLWTVPTEVDASIDDAALSARLTALGLDPAPLIDAYQSREPLAGPARWYEAIITDYLFRIPTIDVAEARVGEECKTFVYEFAHPVPIYEGRMGATHASDVAFWFDNLDCRWDSALRGTTSPQSLADEMHAALLNFLQRGEPGWGHYDTDRLVRIFGGTDPGMHSDPHAAIRQMWTENGRHRT